MTLPLAELRTLAWRQFDCNSCNEPVGRRCVTTSGTRTTPHKSRLDLARGWDARQSELDTLQHALDQSDALLTAANDGLRAITSERDLLKADLQRVNIELSGVRDQVRTLTRDLAATVSERDVLRVRVFELEHPPTPEPGHKTFFGACPEKPGGTSLAAQAGVVSKWGKGAAVRQFFGGISQVAPRHPDAGIVHASWKEYNRANLTAAKVKAALVNLREGDVVEVGHESDNDGLTGAALTERYAVKNLFHDLVKEVRPDLLVSLTLVGYSFDPKSGKVAALEQWVQNCRFDVLGIDCDGVRPSQLPYTDYTAETKTVLSFLAKYPKIKWFAVPEFGCPRIPAADPDGEIRATYHDFYADLWAATDRCLFVTLYEYDSSPNYSLTTPAELAGWKALVGENA